MEMQLLFHLIFVFAAKGLSEAVTITPPDLAKKNPGENCKLQWMVYGTFSNYTIMFSKTGIPTNLGLNTKTDYDSVKGVITLYIWNVQTQDAGYYILTLSTGSQPSTSSNGFLFVYGNVAVNINSLSGKTEFIEGDVIEITCSATSSFTPPGFQNKIYYFWVFYNGDLQYIQNIQNTSSGPAITVDGDVVAGYSLKNNGQTLSIDTAQKTYSVPYCDCHVQEEGALSKSDSYYRWVYTLYSRPVFYRVSPLNKKWNWPSSFELPPYRFSVDSITPVSSYSNWSFVNTSGNQQDIPLSPYPVLSWNNIVLYAPLSGQNGSYGNFTVTLSNTFGQNSITFQLIPPGVSEPPGDFKVQYVTHSVVSLQWRCGWHNGEPQVVTVTLTNMANNTIVETLNTSLVYNSLCYNSLFSSTFQSIVTPDTDYMASIWSTNLYGRSSIATLTVRTPVKPTFSVSCEDISFTESTAIVNVVTSVVGVWMNVSCCVETTVQCITQSMTLLTSQNQIVIDSIPIGDDYVFDFLLFNRTFNYVFSLALIKGIKKSRNADGGVVISSDSDCSVMESTFFPENENRSLLIAVIVLASLLGVAALLLIICIIVIFRLRDRKPTNQNVYEQEIKLPSSANNPEMETDSNYEDITGVNANRFYTPLSENPPPKPPQILMQNLSSHYSTNVE